MGARGPRPPHQPLPREHLLLERLCLSARRLLHRNARPGGDGGGGAPPVLGLPCLLRRSDAAYREIHRTLRPAKGDDRRRAPHRPRVAARLDGDVGRSALRRLRGDRGARGRHRLRGAGRRGDPVVPGPAGACGRAYPARVRVLGVRHRKRRGSPDRRLRSDGDVPGIRGRAHRRAGPRRPPAPVPAGRMATEGLVASPARDRDGADL